MALMPAFVVACALLAVAGLAKLAKPLAARESLALVGVRGPGLVVRCLGAVELAIGLIAALWPGALTGALVALAYGTFCAFLLLLLLRPANVDAGCGCFGDAEASASWSHLALNAAACLVGVLAAVAPPHGLGWALTRPALVAVPLVLGTSAAVLAAYVAFTVFPRAWRAYGLGVEQ